MNRNPTPAIRIFAAAAFLFAGAAVLPAAAAVSASGPIGSAAVTAPTLVSAILADTEAKCGFRLTDPAVIGAAKSADCNHLKLLQMMAPHEEHDADHP